MQNVAIIGAASGIGAATLRLLQKRGCRVTAFDVEGVPDADRFVPLDLSHPFAAAEIASSVQDEFDAVIGNAGIPPRPRNAALLLTVNVLGLTAATEALYPKITKGGSITITASRVGTGWRDHLDEVTALLDIDDSTALEVFVNERSISPERAYFLSKEALIFWCLRRAVTALQDKGVRVNAVSPAPIETPILADFLEVFGDRAKATVDRVGRVGTPEEIAEVLCFVASPQSRWINAQNIIVDGGDTGMREVENVLGGGLL